jgi:hypothetical protein
MLVRSAGGGRGGWTLESDTGRQSQTEQTQSAESGLRLSLCSVPVLPPPMGLPHGVAQGHCCKRGAAGAMRATDDIAHEQGQHAQQGSDKEWRVRSGKEIGDGGPSHTRQRSVIGMKPHWTKAAERS